MEGDEGCALFFLEVVVFAFGGEGGVVEEGLEFFAFCDGGAEAVDDALDAFAALLAFGVGFAGAFDPGDVFDFLDEFVEDVGGVFVVEVDAVFGACDECDEGFDGVAGFGTDLGGEVGVAEGLPDAFVVFAGPIGGEDGGGLSDASVRCVEDAEEGDVGIGRGEELCVGEDVADFAAVVEALCADHAVGDFSFAEGEFEFAALAVGAEEDGEVLPFAADGAFFDEEFFGDEFGFLVIAGHGDDADGIAAFAGGAEDFFAATDVVANEAVGGVEDGVGRAVVFLEADDLGIGEEFLELEDVCDFGAAPAVDGLVVIADDADVIGRADELLEELHLECVGVLELVDGDALEALAEDFPDVGVFAEEAFGEEEEVVEVDGVLCAEFVLIGGGEGGEVVVFHGGGVVAFVFAA